MARHLAGVVMCALLSACSGGGGDDDDSGGDGAGYTIATTPLAGKVGGEAWTIASAETDAFLSDGETDFWADLYPDPVASACSGGPSALKNHVIASIPRAVGRYPLSLSRNATFVIEGATQTIDNLVATRGVIELAPVTATQIQGGAVIEYDTYNSVNGTFTIAVCP